MMQRVLIDVSCYDSLLSKTMTDKLTVFNSMPNSLIEGLAMIGLLVVILLMLWFGVVKHRNGRVHRDVAIASNAPIFDKQQCFPGPVINHRPHLFEKVVEFVYIGMTRSKDKPKPLQEHIINGPVVELLDDNNSPTFLTRSAKR